MRYRAVWRDEETGKIVLGVLTSHKQTAVDEAKFKRSLGMVAWVQNDEDEKVDEL